MPFPPSRGHAALRLGRWSAADAEYFLTCGTNARKEGLAAANIPRQILAVAIALMHSGAWVLRTAVVMPDHVHLLIRLGQTHDLPAAVRLFKGRTAPLLRSVGVRWQRAYFDHRLKDGEARHPIFHYIYLNPYRAGLIAPDRVWKGYFCAADDWSWFGQLTSESYPIPEWLL